MMEPAQARDERRRLATLRALDLLDTEAEERFDRVTRLAKRMFGVEIALVSLVDEDRQWFKSKQGLCATQTPRNISFCGHAILGTDVLVIEDAASDVRFHDNPLVVEEPSIRFYAGAPLRAPNGSMLGTLCIIDPAPKRFTEDDARDLADLAGMVEREIAAVQLATIDELTGLTNRRGFNVIAQHVTALCRRMGKRCSLMYFDLNGFKGINDNLGHVVGDHALSGFSELLLHTFRDSDVIARLGGDEFCVLMSGSAINDAQPPLDRLAKAVADYNANPEVPYDLDYSVGMVDYDPQRDASLESVMRQADEQMYKDKRSPRAS